MEEDTIYKIQCKVEDALKNYIDKEYDMTDLDVVGKLVDIHKDICNEEYWERKVEVMRYSNYGEYGARRPGYNSYGDGYGRRGYDMKYRGEEYMDRMAGEYGRYMEARSRYGNEEADKSYHYMVKSLEDFIRFLYEDADSESQKQMLRETLQRSMM